MIIIFALILMFLNSGIFTLFRTDIAIGMGMATILYVLYIATSKEVKYPLWKNINFTKDILFPVLILFGIWIISSSFLLSFTENKSLSPQSVLTILSTETQYPFQVINPFLDILIFGILIPIVETLLFFGFLYAFLRTVWFSENKVGRIGIWISIILIGLIFSLAHSRSYQLQGSLLLTATIFGIISSYIVEKNKSLSQALILHICINIILRLIALGWLHL